MRPTHMHRSRTRPFAIPTLVAIALSMGLAGVASADCQGPTIAYSGGEVAHGDVITVTGTGFGDNCYDTGPPPPGEGALGRPLGGVEVYIEQGGDRHLVAVGGSEADYSWEVDITVPEVLDLGEARITARAEGGFSAFIESERPLDIASEAVEGGTVDVVEFPTVGDAEVPASEPAQTETDWSPVVWLASGMLLIAVVAVTMSRGRFGSD